MKGRYGAVYIGAIGAVDGAGGGEVYEGTDIERPCGGTNVVIIN